jgi:hypothetical protein
MGTYGGGLARVRYGSLRNFDEGNGLLDNTVSCILPDAFGRLWLGGNKGISVVPNPSQIETFHSIPIAVNQGSESVEMNGGTQSACGQDQSGRLWFALVEGFAFIDLRAFSRLEVPKPRVHIERVVRSGQRLDPTRPVTIEAGGNVLEIGYTGINLDSPNTLSFRYRLAGENAVWVNAGQARDIIYQELPWGNQTFEVQARNLGGPWSDSAKLSISRPVPWYQYRWLWPLLTLLGVLAVLAGTRNREPRKFPARPSARFGAGRKGVSR